MLSNYFLIAFRNLLKSKAFSFINIIGMAISLASCLLIALFVTDELRYDTHHPDGHRTFRLYNESNRGGALSYLPIVPYPFASFMQKDFPEIESTLRVMDTYGDFQFEHAGKKIMESGGLYAEPTVFDMLTIKMRAGDQTKALEKPNSLCLSASLAQKYFGEKNPVGETIKILDTNYEVTAVFEDVPRHSHLKINYLLSMSSMSWLNQFENNWQRQQWFTYIKLKPGADAKALEEKFLSFIKKHAYPTIEPLGFTYLPRMQSIRDVHLHSSNFDWEVAQRGDAQSVYILTASGIMILLIACLNFVNLSTARAIKRMKEVGIRKVVGAQRRQLVFQFMAESILFTGIGFLLAVVLAQMAIPSLNSIIDKDLVLPVTPWLALGSLLFCTLLGTIAGSYPALFLSGFKPASVLAGKQSVSGGVGLRQSLVVVQFMLSFFMVTGSLIVLNQNELINQKDLGFEKDQLVIIPLRGAILRQPESVKAQFGNHPNVISTTLGFGLPGDIIAGDQIVEPVSGKVMPTNLFCVDFDYISTMQMEVIAGRAFSQDFPSDSSEAFVINETAVSTFGLGSPEEAVGKRLDWSVWGGNGALKKGQVVGVVRDFHFKSLREKITPIVMHIYPQASWKIALRVKPENMEETLKHFQVTFEKLDPERIFTYNFLDQNFDAMYKSEQRLGKLFTVFTYLAIVVACLGLFGLVEHSVNQRAREISIRKVFGASIQSLLVLLTRRYFTLLAISFVFVMPISYYLSEQWLNKFAYRTEVTVALYAKAAVVIALITIITVSWQSIKAALASPAHILKND